MYVYKNRKIHDPFHSSNHTEFTSFHYNNFPLKIKFIVDFILQLLYYSNDSELKRFFDVILL